MKHQTISLRLTTVATLLLLCFSAVAQQQNTVAKQDLALRVGVNGPFEIPAFDGGSGSSSNFKRIEHGKLLRKESTIDSLHFKIRREGEIVIVHLSVKLENEKEVPVETYRMTKGETLKTDALTKFGIEPLVLSVVNAQPLFEDPLPPIMPKIENKTKAIDVVGFYPAASPMDNSFHLSLRNVSNKTIIVLDLFMPSSDGNGGEGQRMQGDKDHPLMLPGGDKVTYIGISRSGRRTPQGYVPDVALQRTLIIRTVVFDDGTYDGLVEPAAEIEARRRGLNIQHRRILHLLQQANKTTDGVVTLDEFKEQVFALGKTADTTDAQELAVLFPSLGKKPKGWWLEQVEVGLRDGKLELLRYITSFEEMQKQPGEHITLAEWIEQTLVTYEKLITKR